MNVASVGMDGKNLVVSGGVRKNYSLNHFPPSKLKRRLIQKDVFLLVHLGKPKKVLVLMAGPLRGGGGKGPGL